MSETKKEGSIMRSLVLVSLLAGGVFLLLVEVSLAFDASVGLRDKQTEVAAAEAGDDKQQAGTDEAAMLEKGKQLYGNTCLFCHGAKGVGARAPSLITGHWGPGGANDDEYMMDVIKNGRAGTIMGAFKESHSTEEIKAIIAYLRHEAKLVAAEKK